VGQVSNLPPERKAGWKPAPRRRRWAVAAALLFVLIGAFSMTEATGVTNVRATVMRIFTADGTLIVEVNDPGVKVTIEGDGGLVITGAGPQEVRLRPGSYKLQAAKDGKPIRLDQELVTITRGDKQVVRVAVEPKGLADAAAGPPESDEIRRFEGPAGAIYDVAYSPRESIVAAACHDECIRLWDADSGKLIRILEGHTNRVSGVAFSKDGKQLVSSGYDGTVRLWDVATGEQLQRLETGAELHGVALSGDGTLALCGGGKPGVMGTIQLWDLKNRKRVPGFGDPPSTFVYRVAISPDGRRALSGGPSGILRLWDTASGKELQQLKHPGGVNPAFAPDGRALSSCDDKTVRLWKWEQGKLVMAGRLHGHKRYVDRAVFSPDSRQVVSSSPDNTMRLWDVESGKELHRFAGHTEGLRGLVFSPDGRCLVSGSLVDGSVRLWKVPQPGSYRAPPRE
jgi:WD40 repeat protein